MGLPIPIETSARHIHISQADFEKLFGEGKTPTYKADLSQPGQYVCHERITVKGPKGTFQLDTKPKISLFVCMLI